MRCLFILFTFFVNNEQTFSQFNGMLPEPLSGYPNYRPHLQPASSSSSSLSSSYSSSSLSLSSSDDDDNEHHSSYSNHNHNNHKSVSNDCDRLIINPPTKSGEILSPGYPDAYPMSQTTCHYFIEGEDHERIHLSFPDIDIYPHDEEKTENECDETDSLAVNSVINDQKETLVTLCGKANNTRALMSHDNKFELVFTTKEQENPKHEVTSRGFKVIYTFVTNYGIHNGIQDSNMSCSFSYRSDINSSGNFTSPNYPDNYPRQTECHFLFYGKQHETIQITFEKFDVEGVSNECNEKTQSDYVELSNFNVQLMDRKMSRLCSNRIPDNRRVITSDNNFFRVTFKSNDRFDSTGFLALYEFKRNEDGKSTKKENSLAKELKSSHRYLLLLLLLIIIINIVITSNISNTLFNSIFILKFV